MAKRTRDYSYKFKPSETYTIAVFKGSRTAIDGEEAFQQQPHPPITTMGSMLIDSGIKSVQDYLTHPSNPFPTNKTIHFLIKDFATGTYEEVGSGNPLRIPQALGDNVPTPQQQKVPYVFPQNDNAEKMSKEIVNSLQKNVERERMLSADKEKEIIKLISKHNSEMLKLQQELLDAKAQLAAAEAQIRELKARIEVYEKFSERQSALADPPTPQPTTFEKITNLAAPLLQSPEFMTQLSGLLGVVKNKLTNTVPQPTAQTPQLTALQDLHRQAEDDDDETDETNIYYEDDYDDETEQAYKIN